MCEVQKLTEKCVAAVKHVMIHTGQLGTAVKQTCYEGTLIEVAS